MDFVLLPRTEILLKPGKLFIEARIRDEGRDNFDNGSIAELKKLLETQLSSGDFTFDLLEDILADERSADLRLGSHLSLVRDSLESLKVVEYLGPAFEETSFSSRNVRIEVHVYELYNNTLSWHTMEDFPQAEVTPMPHARFDGVWDELVFAEDIKGDLVWMMINILRFSLRSESNKRGDVNPLILLHGPSGTGKSSLCQGLAQKIAIRLRSKYGCTTLVQINTASLLSKYYSESAKHVDEIFTKVGRMCQEEPNSFTCVLIDEVESIASSREYSTSGNESHDTLRATNALLTGLDKTKHYPNLIFLCTSNMLDALDEAFLDRCGLKREITTPSLESKYEILRQKLRNLVARNVIHATEIPPSFEDAKSSAHISSDSVASRLLSIANEISLSGSLSGRSLSQLPERAILQHLREDECDMDMALTFIERLVKPSVIEQQQQPDEEHQHTTVPTSQVRTDNQEQKGYVERRGTEIEVRGKKRTLRMLLEEDLDIEEVERCISKVRKQNRQEN